MLLRNILLVTTGVVSAAYSDNLYRRNDDSLPGPLLHRRAKPAVTPAAKPALKPTDRTPVSTMGRVIVIQVGADANPIVIQAWSGHCGSNCSNKYPCLEDCPKCTYKSSPIGVVAGNVQVGTCGK